MEKEWRELLDIAVSERVGFLDEAETTRRLAAYLREKHSCTMIIVLSHMRIPREEKLAEMVPEVDMILGGHDHVFNCEMVNGVLLLKSGTDFEEFTDIKVWRSKEILHPPSTTNTASSTTRFQYHSQTRELNF